MSWKYWKRGFVLVVSAAVVLPVARFLYLVTRPVPTELELRAFFSANRGGLDCLVRAVGPRATATAQEEADLLLVAKSCGLEAVVRVEKWHGSRPWRVVMFESPRFSALSGLYELGFAFGDGAPNEGERVVSEIGKSTRGGTNFVPLEDGWALFVAIF